MPQGKGVALASTRSKTSMLERIDDPRRANEAADFSDLDRLGSRPCGIASTAAGNPLAEADARGARPGVAAARAIWG